MWYNWTMFKIDRVEHLEEFFVQDKDMGRVQGMYEEIVLVARLWVTQTGRTQSVYVNGRGSPVAVVWAKE